MKNSVWTMSAAFACILSIHGCGSGGDETVKGNTTDKVKEAVRDAVTKDFKLYDSAKKSLAESAQKSQAELDRIDNELK